MINFFCYKQKTAYVMRISDWSSDVCASDLGRAFLIAGDDQADRAGQVFGQVVQGRDIGGDGALHVDGSAPVEQLAANLRPEGIARPAIARRDHVQKIGRASSGERVFKYL